MSTDGGVKWSIFKQSFHVKRPDPTPKSLTCDNCSESVKPTLFGKKRKDCHLCGGNFCRKCTGKYTLAPHLRSDTNQTARVCYNCVHIVEMETETNQYKDAIGDKITRIRPPRHPFRAEVACHSISCVTCGSSIRRKTQCQVCADLHCKKCTSLVQLGYPYSVWLADRKKVKGKNIVCNECRFEIRAISSQTVLKGPIPLELGRSSEHPLSAVEKLKQGVQTTQKHNFGYSFDIDIPEPSDSTLEKEHVESNDEFEIIPLDIEPDSSISYNSDFDYISDVSIISTKQSPKSPKFKRIPSVFPAVHEQKVLLPHGLDLNSQVMNLQSTNLEGSVSSNSIF